MADPSIEYWTCAVPRTGSEAGDYEDAAAVSVDDGPVCAAVADGATESAFAGEWAGRLARGLVETGATTSDAFRDALPGWQADWREAVRSRTEGRPWYVAAKAVEGAFAAVQGLSMHEDGRWRAVSVGDCCLFHLRHGALLQSWPYETAEAFTNRPALVPSRAGRDVPVPKTTTGTWRPADRLLLATDAVAAWLVTKSARSIAGLSEDGIREAVVAARADASLRNDDATLLVLELAPSPETNEEASTSS